MDQNKKRICSLDTETYYVSNTYSVADLGNWGYTHHELFDCYMVSISRDDGFRWTGHPRDCPWDEVFSPDTELISWNRPFDQAVIERCHELGLIPKPVYSRWLDAACASVYVGAPRSLAGSAEFLLNKKISKDVRSYMSGKRWEDLKPEKQAEVIEYAQGDADDCLAIWLKIEKQWPDHERWLADWTANIPIRGIPVDMERVNAGVELLRAKRDEALAGIPWADTEPPLSRTPFNAKCKELGIPAPQSMAKDSEEFQQWLDQYATDHPFVNCVRDYRRINTFCLKLETIQRKSSNDLFRAELKYFGAITTGRWSGDGKFNIQNLPREEMFGVNLRNCFRAPKGFTYVIFDLSQIEPRYLAVMAGQRALLEAMRQGYGIYEAFARANLAWKGGDLKKENGQLYRLAKALVLLLGYGGSGVKFAVTAKTMAGLDVMELKTDADVPWFHEKLGRMLTVAETVGERLVAAGREAIPEITDYRHGLWAKVEKHLRSHAGTGQTCEFQLHSGRLLRYFDVRNIGGLSAVTVDSKTGKLARRRMWGSLGVENLCQGGSRDVIAWHKRKVEDAGIPVLFSAHDELVAMVEERDADLAYKTMSDIMHTPPDWIPDLPVAAEGIISPVYCK